MNASVLDTLNPEQRAAALHGEGPLLVLAGAGTGKTRVLTHRIARLVDEGVEPWRILAVTFTNKAAGEMRERLAGLLGPRGQGMWIGTFHASCARLLRRHGERIGVRSDFTIFDDDDQKRLVTQILKELGTSERITPRQVLSRMDRARNAGEDPTRVPARDLVDDAARRAFPLYRERLSRENALDFNELLLEALRLFDDPEAAAALRRRFHHVLVDEFQDTNRVQYRIVRELCRERRNLCVVGDDDQSIYRWRGAEPKNLLELDRDYPDAAVIKLERNYRSTQVILRAANAIIGKNPHRHAKALWTEREGGEPILVEECPDDRLEADFVARAVGGLVGGEGRRFDDLAVLYRTHAQSRPFEEVFRAKKIPYRIIGGVSFFQRREVKDMTEYLRLLANPLADTAFERVVNVPTRGIGDTTVERVRAHAREVGIGLYEAARSCAAGASASVGAAARRKLEGFIELMDGLRALVSSGAAVHEVVNQVIQRTGYAERLEIEDKVDGPDRLLNLRELVGAAAAYAEGAGSEATVGGFLERIALHSSVDDEVPTGAVTLMTIHAAKGLEFPVVFLSGMEEGIFPSLREGDLARELEEERRLAYVALTRAKDRIVMTWARIRRTWEEVRPTQSSRFLADIPTDCLAVRARPLAAARRPEMGLRPRRSAPWPVTDDLDQRTAAEADEPVYYLDEDGDDDPTFPKGALVRHKIFGVGEIEDGSGRGPDRKLSVRFPGHGLKTIVARFVEKI